jgi:hypothetical protein
MTLLEPWVMIRLLAGAVATALFAYGALVGVKILRYAHLENASEGRLALERQAELAATLVKVGALAQVVCCVLSVLTADRLSGAIRGAMCGYGVVDQNRWGWVSIFSTLLVSILAGTLLQLFALDRRVRGLDLMRPLAVCCLALAPLVALDWGLAGAWLTRLDLSIVASCCSTTLDEAHREGIAYWQGPRQLAEWGALGGVTLAITAALLARRIPRRAVVGLAGGLALVVAPFALAAVTLEVAPHVYEVPQHLCPFCLFKADAFFIGYPLFGSIFLAVVWGLGAAAGAVVSSGSPARDAFPGFARAQMMGQAAAWALALTLGALPVVVYALTSPGASLFR